MTVAYDVKDLVERLKGHGLEVAETAVRDVVDEVFGWVTDSAKLSATPFDDVALVVLPKIKDEVMKIVDRIDGKVEV